MKNLLPEDIANNESNWLECLVDDELDSQQLQGLCQYFDRTPDAWKRCATALLDDRTMRMGVIQAFATDDFRKAVAPVKAQVKTKGIVPKSTSPLRSWMPMVLCACFAMIMGAIGQRMLMLPQTEQPRDVVSAFDPPMTDRSELDSLPSRSLTQVSFQNAFKPNTLVEIENSPTRAVYYIDHQVPKFLLEAMVIAGHQLSIGQEMVLIDGPNGEALEVPINRLEIEKYCTASL